MRKYFVLDSQSTAVADIKMNNETVKKLWNGFTFTTDELRFAKGEDSTFRLGDTQLPTLSNGKEYALKVDENGIAIVGKDYGGLMRGFNGAATAAYFLTRFCTARCVMRRFCIDRNNASSCPGKGSILSRSVM